jgi:hypothetical protein
MPQVSEKVKASGGMYFEVPPRAQIRSFITMEMLRGAGYAIALVLTIALVLWAIYLVGLLLPEDSKRAPPPMPYSMIAPITDRSFV